MRCGIQMTMVAVAIAATVSGQPAAKALAPDIDPQSLSRLPIVNRADLNDNGKRIFDLIGGPNRKTPLLGPGGISFYSPIPAEQIHLLNEYLRKDSLINGRYFEICALVAAREFDQQYEWTGHEATALRIGIEPGVVDTIKFNKDVAGLNEKDRTVIQLGREIFRQHHASSPVFAKTVELFGRQATMEILETMGDYAMAAVMLTGVDQQLPADRKPTLPVSK